MTATLDNVIGPPLVNLLDDEHKILGNVDQFSNASKGLKMTAFLDSVMALPLVTLDDQHKYPKDLDQLNDDRRTKTVQHKMIHI